MRPAARLADAPSEALLGEIWQRQWLDGGPLVDSSGRQLRVVYPGRRWGGPGPDFQGAILELPDATLRHGDIELHLRASDWQAHGHHLDPSYNRTMLHVVLWAGGAGSVRREDGALVPSLPLISRLAAALPELSQRATASGPALETACLDSAEDAIRLVDRAGLERFLGHAAAFEGDLTVQSPEALLYRGLLIGLGYAANKRPGALLAEVAPWELAARIGSGSDGEARLRALLLGAAGLLPSQRGRPIDDGEPARLEATWRALREELAGPPLRASAWRLIGLRPASWPARRLAGGAALLARWLQEEGPLALFEQAALDQRLDAAKLARLAVASFSASSSEPYWAVHFDFGLSTARPARQQVGRDRAIELAANLLLPLAYALGRSSDRPDLSAAALLAYRALPAGSWNRLSRTMALQLLGPPGLRVCASASRQQGLLHLFKRWCWERRCEECPAGARHTSRATAPTATPSTLSL
jgi:hypothetical protein